MSKPNIRRVTLQQKLTMKALYDEGYTLQSIADYTGKSLTTVKRHIYGWNQTNKVVIVDDANVLPNTEKQVDQLVEQAKKHLARGGWRRALHKLQQADKIAWSPDWM